MTYHAEVVRGKGTGKKIGFPTLNLSIPEEFSCRHGIYAGWVSIDRKKYPGAFHFGPIPTFKEARPTLEVFLLDTELTDAPDSVLFELVQYLRDIIAFGTAEELSRQIEKDVEEVKRVLNKKI